MKVFTKQKKKNKFKIRFIFFFIIIFFLGIFFERFEIKNLSINKLNSFFYEIINNFSSSTLSKIYKIEKIEINVNYKNYNKILETRNISLSKGRATEDIHKWVPAKLNFNTKEYKAKIKLKGVHPDHWSHPTKWSFSIKLNNDSLLGLKRFSIQQPVIRDYLYEWLFMRALKKENLISHHSDYYQIIFNGNNLGLYYLEEVYAKQLIERNKRREGPIIGLNKDLWVKEANNLKNLGINELRDSFWRAKIEPIRFSEDQEGTDQEILLQEALNKFETFRENPTTIHKIFDTQQLATSLALKTIFGAYEFDWKDIKFYYNPITKLLEPIVRELHLNVKKTTIPNWWSGNVFENNSPVDDQNTFLKLLFQDIVFYEMYLKELNRLINDEYIEKLAEINKKDFDRNLKILNIYYPTDEVFSFNHLNNIKENIKNVLNPTQGLNAYYLKYENNYLFLNIQNVQHLPIKIKSLNFNDELTLEVLNDNIIEGYKSKKAASNYNLKVYCENSNFCKKELFNNVKINFNILGQKKKKNVKISKYYSLAGQKKSEQQFSTVGKNHSKNKSLFTIDEIEKKISFLSKKVFLDRKVVIPKNYTFNIADGTEIYFSREASIVSYSTVNFNGTKENPIIVSSKETYLNSESEEVNQNITIINAKKQSLVNNTVFTNLYGPKLNSGSGIKGVINFYNSDVSVKNSIFEKNFQSDDYLNIINSDFEISDSSFKNNFLDSIDIDFSNGTVTNTKIYNSGNDAFDFSGSNVKLNNIYGKNIRDKFISVGEASSIHIENLSLENAKIGIASKDLSNLKVENLQMNNIAIAVTAYQKKTEYGPAKIILKNSNIKNFEYMFLSQNGSSINSDGIIIENSNYDYGKL